MRQLRTDRGLTLRGLSRAAHIDPGYLSRLESEQQVPSDAIAARLDSVLNAAGALAQAAEADREPAHDRAVRATSRESLRLARLLDATGREQVDQLGAETGRLAVAYLRSPAAQMLTESADARRAAAEALAAARRPAEITDLASTIGHLSGVLAYAALDLGHPADAMTHMRTAWSYADAAGDDRLRAWIRGTQSLIARFDADYQVALTYAEDGLRYAGPGTSRERLLCGVAQCRANMGDSAGAHRALNAAADIRDSGGPDEMGGLFTFSAAKQAYYSASSLIWLDKPADARKGRRGADEAMRLWTAGDVADRSLDDEALAHVYAATASVQLKDIDAAAAYLAPILDLPEDRRISWIRKRMMRVADLLGARRYAGSQEAAVLRERIAEYR